MASLHICAECLDKKVPSPFMAATRKEFERHLIADHKCGFGNVRCMRCKETFYDYDHFKEHTKGTSPCNEKPFMTDDSELSDQMKKAFELMVGIVMRPIDQPEFIIPSVMPVTPVPATPTVATASSVQVNQPEVANGFNRGGLETVGHCSYAPTPVKPPFSSETSAPPPEKRPVSLSAVVSPPRVNIRFATPNVKEVAFKADKKEPSPRRASSRFQQALSQPVVVVEMDVNVDENENGNNQQSFAQKPKKTLDLCQLCLELENDRPPIFSEEERQHHAYMHLKYAASFRHMTEPQVRAHPKMQEVSKMCFEESYYNDMKRRRQISENN